MRVTNKNIYKYSVFFNALKCLSEKYEVVENNIEEIYLLSSTGKTINRIILMARKYYYHCFFYRLVEFVENHPVDFLKSSRIVQTVLRKWKYFLSNFRNHARESNFMQILESHDIFTKKAFINTAGLMLLVALLFNSILVFFLDKDFSLFGLMMRGILSILGCIMLFSNVKWEEVIDGSKIFKIISNSERR